MKLWGTTIAAAGIVMAGMAAAQDESTNRVAAVTDWSVFVEEDPALSCWGVSAPKAQENTRDGQVVAVRRGDALLFITNIPGEDVRQQVSFLGGYPFAPDSTVTLTIGGRTFNLFTQGENAWAMNAEEDAAIVEAMRAGTEAVVVGRSSRGTRTEDTFSLLGFTAALEEASSRCGG